MCPYKDEEQQREAVKFAARRYREKRKREAEALGKKFEEELPLEPENLNYGMEPTKEKPMTWEEFGAENSEATKKEWIDYKIRWSYEHKWRTEKEGEDKRKARDEREKYQTSNHDCILFRRMYEKGQRSDFYMNHLLNCMACGAWAHQNAHSLDLNATGKSSDKFEELRGFIEFMQKKDEPD